MYFLIQSNIQGDTDHEKIIQALEELNIGYETIELTNLTDKIEVKAHRNDVFVFGSVKLARLAKSNTNWYPGSFYGENHLFEVNSKYYKDNLLNYQTEIFKFGDHIEWKDHEYKFIKPYKDAKIFTGKVFTKIKWQDFVEESLLNPKTPLLTIDSIVQASIPQEIIKEARLWVVGKQVVASVYYKFHKDITFETEVASDGIEFAKKMIDTFNVAKAFVMDICLTYSGWKIVEINCINSAGFYPNLNVKSLVRSLDVYFTD
jgi:ATP-grasp domain, R2K clade family 3